MKIITLKLVELSQPKFYLQFGKSLLSSFSFFNLILGLSNTKSSVESAYTPEIATQSTRQYDTGKDSLISSATVTAVEHIHETLNAVRGLYPKSEWHLRWQKLARRY